MSHIDFEAKSDHDLLVQAVTRINGICDRLDKINGWIEKHEERHTREARTNCETRSSKLGLNWQTINVLIVLAGGLIFTIVRLLGG